MGGGGKSGWVDECEWARVLAKIDNAYPAMIPPIALLQLLLYRCADARTSCAQLDAHLTEKAHAPPVCC